MRLIATIAAIALAIMAAMPAQAAKGDWELLGEADLGRRMDDTTFKVGRYMGSFDTLRLSAKRGTAVVEQVTVTYENGRKQDFVQGRLIVRENGPVVLDLRGGERDIREIYVAARVSRREEASVILVEARSAGDVPTPDGYDYLATTTYDIGASEIVIPVGDRVGAVSALRLRALDAPVFVGRAEIRYGNGRSEEIRLRDRIDVGELSDEIDLRGRRPRDIEEVRLAVRSPNGRGTARVQLLGEQAGRGRFADRRDRRDDRFGRGVPGGTLSDADFTELGYRFVDSRLSNAPIVLDLNSDIGVIRVEMIGGGRREIDQVTVSYNGGGKEDIDVDFTLVEGRKSAPIELRRNPSGARIEMVSLRMKAVDNPGRGAIGFAVHGAELPDPALDGRRFARPPEIRNGEPEGYIYFGSQQVGFRGDTDRIEVGRRKGQFESIAFIVRNRGIRVRAINVVYANGERDELNVNRRIPRDSVTPAILLDGNRFIDHIELVYRAFGPGDGPATVEAYGAYSDRWRQREQERDTGWELLGSEQATPVRRDTDIIQVGRSEGRFDKLRLHVKRADVRFSGITITYGNGQTENVAFNGTLGAGEVSDEIDIAGRGRFIRAIQLRYSSRFSLRGSGIVEVWGHQAPGRGAITRNQDGSPARPEDLIRRGMQELLGRGR